MNLKNALPKLMGLETIAPDKLDKMIESERVTVLDVNSRQSWIRAHVPGAFNLDPLSYSESDLPVQKGSNLVFYCSNPLCRKAPKAAKRAGKMGYTSVKVMSAGISGWISAGFPTEGGRELTHNTPPLDKAH